MSRLPGPGLVVLGLWALVCMGVALPLIDAGRAPPDRVFLGLTANAHDQWVYLSWIEQARQGQVTVANLYDPAPSRAVFFNLFFCGVGWLAGATGLTSMQAYHLTHLALIPALLVTLWWLTGAFLSGSGARTLAVAWLALGGGLGWVEVAARVWMGQRPTLDDWPLAH